MRILPINVGRTNVQNSLDFLTALLAERHKRGRLRHRGELQVSANNIDVTGADILNEGKGRTYVSAKNKMSLGTLEIGFSEKMGGGNHTRVERVTESLISRVKGKGDVVLSGKDIWSAGAELEAKNKFMALAENDLVLGTATVDSDFEEFL